MSFEDNRDEESSKAPETHYQSMGLIILPGMETTRRNAAAKKNPSLQTKLWRSNQQVNDQPQSHAASLGTRRGSEMYIPKQDDVFYGNFPTQIGQSSQSISEPYPFPHVNNLNSYAYNQSVSNTSSISQPALGQPSHQQTSQTRQLPMYSQVRSHSDISSSGQNSGHHIQFPVRTQQGESHSQPFQSSQEGLMNFDVVHPSGSRSQSAQSQFSRRGFSHPRLSGTQYSHFPQSSQVPHSFLLPPHTSTVSSVSQPLQSPYMLYPQVGAIEGPYERHQQQQQSQQAVPYSLHLSNSEPYGSPNVGVPNIMTLQNSVETGMPPIPNDQLDFGDVHSMNSSKCSNNQRGDQLQLESSSLNLKQSTAGILDMTPATAKRNRCTICNKQFRRPSSLKTHYYSHTGEKIFKCPWKKCGKLFSVKSNMTRHYKLHERDQKLESAHLLNHSEQ